jgi:hypothetical protein
MYLQPSSNQLISDGDLTLQYNLRPGAHNILLGYGFHYVYDTPPDYDWITQRLVKGEVEAIENSPYFQFPYTIEELTEEEIAINREKKRQLDWIPFREQRDQLLKESDWTQISDYSLVTEEEKVLWAEYRQALRDLPETYPNSEDIVWPSQPQPIIVFTNPTPTITEEPVITFDNTPVVEEPSITEEPVVQFDVTSSFNSTTTGFGDTTSFFGDETTSVFS